MMMFLCEVAVDTNREAAGASNRGSDPPQTLTVIGGDLHRDVNISSTFGPLASSGGAGVCVPGSRYGHVAVLNGSSCRQGQIGMSASVTSSRRGELPPYRCLCSLER